MLVNSPGTVEHLSKKPSQRKAHERMSKQAAATHALHYQIAGILVLDDIPEPAAKQGCGCIACIHP